MFAALILDFAGVLTTPLSDSWDAWNTGQELPYRAWRHVIHDTEEGRQLYLDLEFGRITQAQWNARMGELLEVEGTNLMGRAHAEVKAVEPMLAVARAARAAGMKLALLSNSYGLEPFNPYQAIGAWDLFDVRVLSELEGTAKPDPLIYRRTLDLLEASASDCVFVDDRAENLVPAQQLGIQTVLCVDPSIAALRLADMLDLEAVDVS